MIRRRSANCPVCVASFTERVRKACGQSSLSQFRPSILSIMAAGGLNVRFGKAVYRSFTNYIKSARSQTFTWPRNISRNSFCLLYFFDREFGTRFTSGDRRQNQPANQNRLHALHISIIICFLLQRFL